jgi:hypothetical protein
MATKNTCITTSKLLEMLEDTIPNYYVTYFKLVLSDGTTVELNNDNSPNVVKSKAEEL